DGAACLGGVGDQAAEAGAQLVPGLVHHEDVTGPQHVGGQVDGRGVQVGDAHGDGRADELHRAPVGHEPEGEAVVAQVAERRDAGGGELLHQPRVDLVGHVV